MTINLTLPDIRELRPRITVFGVGGAGGNAVNNMITAGLQGVDFVVANTDAQALTLTKAERMIQMGVRVTEGLGAGSQPEVGRAAAEEVFDEIRDHLAGAHMVFVTAGMGGGTGTGAAPVIAQTAKELGILTVGVVTKPFHFEGARRMRVAEAGISELQKAVDTLLIIPNQNLFRVANEKTTFADAFAMADQVLYSGVACITDLMVKEGLINLDFADVRAVMREMGKAMMGTGEASGEKRAMRSAEAAISNPLIDDVSMKGARGLLVSITGGRDLTLYEVDEAATRIREEVDSDANIIVGATFDESLEGIIRVSVVATGIDLVEHQAAMNAAANAAPISSDSRLAELTQKLRAAQPKPLERANRTAEPATAAEQAAAAEAAARDLDDHDRHAYENEQATIEDVTIRPLTMKQPVYSDMHEDHHAPVAHDPAPQKTFIPPQAERPASRAPRMPRIDELPLPAQNELRARREQPAAESPAEKPKLGLLQRLASVGLGRREEAAAKPAEQRQPIRPAPVPRPVERAPAPAPRLPESRVPEQVAEYGRRSAPPRPAPQGLDLHGRPAPMPASDDDHLEIPAFLRRQAK
jgi:cell division protein FtsZ